MTATAELKLQNTNPGAECFITIGSDTTRVQEGGENGGPFITAAETVAVSITANSTLQEWCEVEGTGDNTIVEDSSITAIRVMSSHGKKPATATAKDTK